MKLVSLIGILVLSLIFMVGCGGDDPENFEIPDANLRAAIEQELGLPSGAPITEEDMRRLAELEIDGENLTRGISNLTGLEYATNLVFLFLRNNAITDLSPLAGLTKLEELHLSNSEPRDISLLIDLSPLAGLNNLYSLELGNNAITDLSPLTGLTKLEELELYGNAITDLSPLTGLNNLVTLILSGNAITDLSPLAGLTQLSELDLSGNAITDLSPLTGLNNLVTLILSGNAITDLSPLTGLTQLRSLLIYDNPLSATSINRFIPIIEANGTSVIYD